ncbi:MAG: hypothetical protein QOH49_1628 [Acidobacteriota bacterium]|nr:hypothetical protein [Acidobacteriota bacterium]
MSARAGWARALRRRPELGDALLFLYVSVFARQCFWRVEPEAAAWALAAIASGFVLLAYLATKPEPAEKTPRLFWVVVGLPLLAVYLSRVAFPDLSFDVLNHRLIQGERGLRGVQLLAGDFFPTIFPFNPSSDMLTGVGRHLLGYRLGTVINYLALLWAGTILYRLLRPVVERTAWRCLAVLLVLWTEHVLFEVNNYMVDLLALPLLLEATRLGLGYRESESKARDLLFAALLLGASVALKLTNAAAVLPVLVIFAVRVLFPRPERLALKLIPLAAALFFIPLLPHFVYIYGETGSPVFPLYNKFLKSQFWPLINPYDGRWGPRDWQETLLWPLASVALPERLSELNVYSGRIAFGVIAAGLCLLLPRAGARARLLALAVLLGSMLWSVTSGYIRYALFTELLSGLVALYLARIVFERLTGRGRALRVGLAALPACVLVAQSALALAYVSETEWSKRPTLLDAPGDFRREMRWMWRDRDLLKFQTEETRALFSHVDAWVVSGVKTNGVEVLLRPDVPMLAVNNLEYFDRRRSLERFARAAEQLRGRGVYSLAMAEDLDAALGLIRRRGLGVGATRRLRVPFYSARTEFDMVLIEVVMPPRRETPHRAGGEPEVTEASEPLPYEASLAGFSAAGVPEHMRAGEEATISITVRNMSEYVWPGRGRKDLTYTLNVADSWLDGDGSIVNNTDGRSGIPRDLWPGEEAVVPLKIKAPKEPGEYVLEIDVVQERVTFFKDRDSVPLHLNVRVE